jgi:hypothetical protein
MDANYPLSNLSDLKNIRAVAQRSAAGALSFTLLFSAARTLQFLALIHHNCVAGDTVRYRLFSGTGADPVANAGTMIHDSGNLALFPGSNAPSSRLAAVRPYLLSSALSVRSARVDVATAGTVSIGGLELSGWYEWQNVLIDRERGFRSTAQTQAQADGADQVMGQWSPRVWDGGRDLIDQTELESTFMDFQREKKLSLPFVFAWDYDDSTTWTRECALVKNTSLPRQTADYPFAGRMRFAFEEHLG